MTKFIPMMIVLLASSQSLAQEPSVPEEEPAPQKCEEINLFTCINDPKNFPWLPGPGNGGLNSERPDPDFKTLEKLDQQFNSLKEMRQ